MAVVQAPAVSAKQRKLGFTEAEAGSVIGHDGCGAGACNECSGASGKSCLRVIRAGGWHLAESLHMLTKLTPGAVGIKTCLPLVSLRASWVR